MHQQWIGYLNPTGLVFSPQALEDAQVVISNGVVSEQRNFARHICSENEKELTYKGLDKCETLFLEVLNWRESDLDSSTEVISEYTFKHPQFEEIIFPTYVSKINETNSILIKTFEDDLDFDVINQDEDQWNSSVHFKFERLLREKEVSTGILLTKHKLRLIFAPRGETSGYIDFPFKIMFQPSGRLIFAVFNELFSDTRVFNSPKNQSLVEILEISRKYQAKVSIELSGQVLTALYELLRGFQAANDEDNGELLEKTLKENPQDIYEGLLTVLLRMVFIMYSEDRDLLASDEVYESSYSLAGLYERLRQDEAQNPDTMDSRYGAWAHLLSLFRLIYDGANYEVDKGEVNLPPRHGHLFDPNKYLFLEGRQSGAESYTKAPKISDGTIYKVLTNLLLLDGERISYRTLDVEQIGSVYETMMGFELAIAEGETIALKPPKTSGAPIPINIDAVLNAKDKSKKITDLSGVKLTDKLKKELKEAKTPDEVEHVLDKRIDRRATPYRLSKGAMILSPSEARRKSGSHYTPRELTEPIVRTALRPIFERLGNNPTPEEILELKVCDPAMGSGAFLVEACRQLSEKLVEAWGYHKTELNIPHDEDELLYAKRVIAQRCLYGIDKNHMAVNLAKLSIWLVTLAKDHAFSFLDHNLKYGDSLVGLSNKQIMAFDYKDRPELPLFAYMKEKLSMALYGRSQIQNATEEQQYDSLAEMENSYSYEMQPLRLVGNLAIKCFFDGKKEKDRDKKIQEHQLTISNFFAAEAGDKLVEYCNKYLEGTFDQAIPLHWELEFPEVFDREDPGFDCFVGNPPFLGGTKIGKLLSESFRDFLYNEFPKSGNRMDLVGYFFRKAFSLLRTSGSLGLISTNTISQGDSRQGTFPDIFARGGEIYSAKTRITWPGDASVMVTVIHIYKGKYNYKKDLDGRQVSTISQFLLPSISQEPFVLKANSKIASKGIDSYGATFRIEKCKKSNNPILPIDNLTNEELKRIVPYLGGEDINSSPSSQNSRYIIDLGDIDEEKEVCERYPNLSTFLKEGVVKNRKNASEAVKNTPYWKFWNRREAHLSRIRMNSSTLACCQTSKFLAFAFVPSDYVIDQKVVSFSRDDYAYFQFYNRIFMTLGQN